MKRKVTTLLAIVPTLCLLDWVTKRWALEALAGGRTIDVIPGFLPFTLAFNRGAAFGLEIGSDPRMVFVPITILALGLLANLFRQADESDWLRLISLSLVIAGALGNLYDRLRWDRGVVDFIGPANLGFADFPIFNVADMAISCGAILLAWSFFLEEKREKAAALEGLTASQPVLDPAD